MLSRASLESEKRTWPQRWGCRLVAEVAGVGAPPGGGCGEERGGLRDAAPRAEERKTRQGPAPAEGSKRGQSSRDGLRGRRVSGRMQTDHKAAVCGRTCSRPAEPVADEAPAGVSAQGRTWPAVPPGGAGGALKAVASPAAPAPRSRAARCACCDRLWSPRGGAPRPGLLQLLRKETPARPAAPPPRAAACTWSRVSLVQKLCVIPLRCQAQRRGGPGRDRETVRAFIR